MIPLNVFSIQMHISYTSTPLNATPPHHNCCHTLSNPYRDDPPLLLPSSRRTVEFMAPYLYLLFTEGPQFL
jgi:hypothetical protein